MKAKDKKIIILFVDGCRNINPRLSVSITLEDKKGYWLQIQKLFVEF